MLTDLKFPSWWVVIILIPPSPSENISSTHALFLIFKMFALFISINENGTCFSRTKISRN